MTLSDVFKKSPRFYNWTQQKSLQASHLSLLEEFEDFTALQTLLEWIAQHSPTHSEGLQILETGGELILMGHSIQALLQKNQQSKTLIQELKKLRYPIRSAQQDRQKKILSEIALGKDFKIKTLTQGDQSGLSIEFKSFQLRDFKQKIQKLNNIYEQLQKKEFWKKG